MVCRRVAQDRFFTVETHHERVDFASPGEDVGLIIKGLNGNNRPRSDDVMMYMKDTTLGKMKGGMFSVGCFEIANDIKAGCS